MWISRARVPAMVIWPTPLIVWIEREICLSAISVRLRKLIASDDTISDITGSASGSTLVMTGGSSSGGTNLMPDATFSRTSLTASLRLRSRTKRTVIDAAALADARRDLVDAGDAADRLFHRLDHRRGNLVGAGAGQGQ